MRMASGKCRRSSGPMRSITPAFDQMIALDIERRRGPPAARRRRRKTHRRAAARAKQKLRLTVSDDTRQLLAELEIGDGVGGAANDRPQGTS